MTRMQQAVESALRRQLWVQRDRLARCISGLAYHCYTVSCCRLDYSLADVLVQHPVHMANDVAYSMLQLTKTEAAPDAQTRVPSKLCITNYIDIPALETPALPSIPKGICTKTTLTPTCTNIPQVQSERVLSRSVANSCSTQVYQSLPSRVITRNMKPPS